MKLHFLKTALIAFAISPLVISCEDFNEQSLPKVETGTLNASKYVAVGNSLAAGYQNGAVYGEAQDYSYPYLIARQLQLSDAEFKIPRLAEGVGDKIEVASFNPPGSPSPINTTIRTLPGTALIAQYIGAQPSTGYQNTGIPGAVLADYLGLDFGATFAQRSAVTANPYYAIVLGPGTSSIHSYVASQNPTFVTFWLGNNDILGYVTSGGLRGSNTDAGFEAMYRASMASLLAISSNPSVITATIPGVTDIPFTTFVTATAKSIFTAQSSPGIFVMTGTFASGTETASFLPTSGLGTSGLLLLTAQTILPYLGQASGAPWRQTAATAGIPVANLLALYGGAVDTTTAFGGPTNPVPNNFVLDATEIAYAQARVTAFNNVIRTVVTENTSRVGLVDVNAIFAGITAAGGIIVDGLQLAPAPLSLFSLDGVHPTNRGHAVVANEFIKVMNSKFGASIPLINVRSIPSGVPISPNAN